MARLGIDIEKVAALRDLGAEKADPLRAAVYAEVGGADGIVCPLNEGLRPVTERDVSILKEVVTTHLNIQVPPLDALLSKAMAVGPDMITLKAGKAPGQTAGGGLDVLGHIERISQLVADIRSQDIVTCLLIDPDIHQVKAAAKAATDYVELHTGLYIMAEDLNERADKLEDIRSAAAAAAKLGLGVSAGQGLTYQTVPDIVSIEQIEEINVGAPVISQALWIGMEAAVRDMVALVK